MNLYTTFVLNASRSPETAEGDPGRRFMEDRMAVNYYIADKPIKAEYEAFRKFWEDELFPEFIKKLSGYCQETGGRIVNKDLAEEIAEDHLCGYSCVPLSETTYKTPLVTVNHAGIFWRKCLIEDRPVNSLEDLIVFFSRKERQERYQVEDEKGRAYTLNELMDLLK